MKLIFISVICGFTAFEMLAQTPPDSLSLQLHEIVVTARKPSEDIIPAQILSGEELHRLNSNSVADALRFFPVFKSRIMAEWVA